MEWSRYQQALFDFGVNSSHNGIVTAVAGSGKTASIEELCRRLPESMKVKYLVFNKRNADEAQRRMPENVSASTFHSACMHPLRQAFGRFRVDGDKTRALMDDLEREGLLSVSEVGKFASPVRQLVGLAKNTGIGTKIGPDIDDVDAWQDIVDHFGIEVNLPRGASAEDIDANQSQLVEISQGILLRSIRDTGRIDFDDMLYMVSYYDLPTERYDMLCVDEAQDTNAIQRDILGRMLGGRLIAVGDHRQAIYGFRGADVTAMQLIGERFECDELPLSINYRCSTAVIDAARPYCPQLEAHAGAPAGSVETLDAWKISDFAAGDAVLCRTTAPLIQLAMRMIGQRMPVAVLGRDIGAGLVRVVRPLANGTARTVADFDAALDRYELAEEKRIANKRNVDALRARLDDRVSALRAFIAPMSGEDPIEAIVDGIEGLFSDRANDGQTTLATVHKAKGMEWPRVFILGREALMPLKWARQPWEIEQESNLIYVAMTRAKVDLRMVEVDRIGD